MATRQYCCSRQQVYIQSQVNQVLYQLTYHSGMQKLSRRTAAETHLHLIGLNCHVATPSLYEKLRKSVHPMCVSVPKISQHMIG